MSIRAPVLGGLMAFWLGTRSARAVEATSADSPSTSRPAAKRQRFMGASPLSVRSRPPRTVFPILTRNPCSGSAENRKPRPGGVRPSIPVLGGPLRVNLFEGFHGRLPHVLVLILDQIQQRRHG